MHSNDHISEALRSLASNIGGTRLLSLDQYARGSLIQLKMESDNPWRSSKDRTGLYLVRGIVESRQHAQLPTLVESSSGNLGRALAAYARVLGLNFLCLVDPTIAEGQLSSLREVGAQVEIVNKGSSPDYRTARLRRAEELDRCDGYVWTRQYENPDGMRAHEETTGPEIFEQTHGEIDVVVVPVGSGGTICGIGRYLKRKLPSIRVVGVEPAGSTIFGGTHRPYLTAGAGFRGTTKLVEVFGNVIDSYSQVDDVCAIYHCRSVRQTEGLVVGITTGAALAAASAIAAVNQQARIVVISPDAGEAYSDIIDDPVISCQHSTDILPIVLQRPPS